MSEIVAEVATITAETQCKQNTCLGDYTESCDPVCVLNVRHIITNGLPMVVEVEQGCKQVYGTSNLDGSDLDIVVDVATNSDVLGKSISHKTADKTILAHIDLIKSHKDESLRPLSAKFCVSGERESAYKESDGLTVKAKRQKKPGCKQVYDKSNFCIFCTAEIRSKIARHLLTRHKNEPEVADIVCLTPKCKARVAVLRQLANDGNFKHNAEVFRQKFGHVVVARRATNTTCQVAMQLPCEFCHKFMNKSSLWRHKRRCSAQLCDARSDSESDADEVVLESESKRNARRISAVKGGRALLNSTVFVGDEEVLGELMNRMRESTVKEVVMCDKLIRHYAVTRMEALGHKSDQKPADIHTVSQSVRTLGRFVEMARNTQPSISLDGLLTANYFDLCAITARKMSIDKEVPALNLGRVIGLLLTKVAILKRGCALREGNRQALKEAREFRVMHQSYWNSKVNSAATRRMNTLKHSKARPIPLTDDLMKLRSYIITKMKELVEHLRKVPNAQAWEQLAKLTMSRLILFNGRRRAEVQNLKVNQYQQRPKWHEEEGDEMEMALSTTDRLLAKRY